MFILVYLVLFMFILRFIRILFNQIFWRKGRYGVVLATHPRYIGALALPHNVTPTHPRHIGALALPHNVTPACPRHIGSLALPHNVTPTHLRHIDALALSHNITEITPQNKKGCLSNPSPCSIFAIRRFALGHLLGEHALRRHDPLRQHPSLHDLGRRLDQVRTEQRIAFDD